MDNLSLIFDLVNLLLLIVISVVVHRQTLDHQRVEELLKKASEGAQKTDTTVDDTVVSLAEAIFKFLGSLRAIHVEVKPETDNEEAVG